MKYDVMPLTRLIEQFARLPGIGRKTAQRLAFYVLNLPHDKAKEFADTILEAHEKIKPCSVCQNLTDREVCQIYSLNPADDAQIGTILGCFQNSEVPGKIQHGSAWWFNDHKIGMEEQMTRLASLGLLGNFVGMLTDSRSFLSYTRHDYFRRILCNIIGQWVEDGEYPNDEKALEKIVKGICFDNAKRYFNL